jgi:MbtH protein
MRENKDFKAMSSSPFDDAQGTFYALVNDEEQYSLWPTFKEVPAGWQVAFGGPDGAARDAVLAWIDKTWTDMRPKSLRVAISQSAPAA